LHQIEIPAGSEGRRMNDWKILSGSDVPVHAAVNVAA